MADSDKALPLSVLSTIRDWVRSLIPTKTSDLTNDSGFAQKNIWYGTCGTAAGTAAKVVTTSSGDFELATGSMVRVYFTNANTYNGTATLNVDGKGAKNISRVGSTTTTRYYWSAGEVVDFVYDGTRFVMSRSGTATTTYFGLTKLATSAYSTSTSTALTPQSLNGLAQYMLSGVAPYSASATYAVGDRVRYGYYIYECNTAITTAEAWTAAHWTALEPLLDMIEAKADAEDVPTKTSELTNDSGFLTAETDPTVPAWAKAASKPAYTAAEVGAQPTLVSGTNIKTINTVSLLGSGDIEIEEAMTPLIGVSENITPYQVQQALQEGRDICVTHLGYLQGVALVLNFTAWANATDAEYGGAAIDVVVSQTIAYYNSEYYLYELVGTVRSGVWELLPTVLAKKADIPTNMSDLFNDSGFITGYTETDPTVPSWAKAASKPSYTASEVGAIPTTGGEVTGDVTLKAAAATNSPSFIFQRGTLTDNYNDWRLQDRGGFLYFDQRGQGSTDWSNQVVFNTSGNIAAASFSGSGSGLTGLNASNLSSGTVPAARLDLSGYQTALVSGTNIKTVNGNSLLGSGDIQISASGTVDASLDPQSTNPVQNSAIYSGIETAKMDMLETATTVFTVIVSGTTAYLQAGITAVAYAYTTTQGCVFLQPLAAMSGWSDANVRIYQVADVDIPNGTIKLVSVEGSTIHIIDLTDDGNGAMAGTYTSVTIPSAITVDNSLDISSSNPVANSAIAAAINNIQSFCDLFNKKLTMSKSSWSSGTCTITNISKYSLVVIVASEPIVMVRTVGGTTWRGSLLTGSGTQYGKDFYFTASGDTCTYGNGVQLTHTASGNHSAATTAVAITACYGIVPLLS